jgi:hypothetical protein
MTPALAQELQDAGYPDIQDVQHREGRQFLRSNGDVSFYSLGEAAPHEGWFIPTLEELINAIPAFARLCRSNGRWFAKADTATPVGDGETATEAVARLWLALQSEQYSVEKR